MANEFTKYEVGVVKDERVFLSLGFTAKKTKAELFRLMMANGPEVLIAAEWTTDEGEFVWNSKAKRIELPTGYAVTFTGNTENVQPRNIRHFMVIDGQEVEI